jgi:DNA-binding transcriptional regulator YiaG
MRRKPREASGPRCIRWRFRNGEVGKFGPFDAEMTERDEPRGTGSIAWRSRSLSPTALKDSQHMALGRVWGRGKCGTVRRVAVSREELSMPRLGAVLRREFRRAATRQLERALARFRRMQRRLRLLRLQSNKQRQQIARIESRLARVKERARSRGRAGAGLAERVRSLRARLKMTRLKFAELVGVSPGSIFGWETGRTVPREASLARLSKLRGQRPDRRREKQRRQARVRRTKRKR